MFVFKNQKPPDSFPPSLRFEEGDFSGKMLKPDLIPHPDKYQLLEKLQVAKSKQMD
jgi:hypothetical protein